MPKTCIGIFFLFVIAISNSTAAFVGVSIGTSSSTLPTVSDIVAILKSNQITHVRLFNSDANMLNALSNTGIEVMVSVTNKEVLGIGLSPSTAATWVIQNIVAYLPSTNITAIAVGSEVLSSIPNAAPILVPAMNNLHKALVSSNLNSQVKVSTPQSMDMISKPFPPSAASFNSTFNSSIFQILQFLKNTNSYYMLNAYPYYGYVNGNGIFPIDYALFNPLSPSKEIVDPNTLFHYDSMFDAMVDATYNSIASYNFSGIPIVVTESGWPWFGGANEPDATIVNAETFNNNLVRHVLEGPGPPSQPSVPINTYIYELFNEDHKFGPVSERHWGLYFTNGSAVYSFVLGTSSQISGNGSLGFCIAKPGADHDALQKGLNWACGPGRANCSAIQLGQPCYYPDTVQNHASFAYNDYYQRMQSAGGTCDFDNTATITNIDPSYGSCFFTGSSSSSSGGIISPSSALGPVAPPSGQSSKLQIPKFELFVLAMFVTSVLQRL